MVDGFRRGCKGKGGGDHLVARADAERTQSQMQRIGTRGTGDGMPDTKQRGRFPFECRDVRT